MKLSYLLVFLPLVTGAGKIYAQAPKVISFSPVSGPAGTKVTINGSGFSAIADSNVVYFGATHAAVTTASTSQLLVTVPVGATYQPIAVINKTTRLSAISALAFSPTFSLDDATVYSRTRLIPYTPAMDIQAADIDGDGKTDLLATSPATHTMMVLISKAKTSKIDTGSFVKPVTFPAGPQPGFVAIDDLDGDGRPDIMLMDVGFSNTPNGNNSLFILQNLSTAGHLKLSPVTIIDSTKTTPASYNFQLKPGDNVTHVGDFDGDGKPDVAVSNTAGFITIYRNKFIAGQPLKKILGSPAVINIGLNPTSFAVGDMDGDGKLDIVATNYDSSSITVLRNTSTTDSISFQRIDFPLDYHPLVVSLGDIDGDGKLDALIGRADNKASALIHNTSTPGHFNGAVISLTNVTALSNYNGDIIIQDANGDAKPDILSLSADLHTYLYTNQSTPGQTSAGYFINKTTFPTITIPDRIADLDGDGGPEMIVGSIFGIDIYHSKASPVKTQTIAPEIPTGDMVIYPNPASGSTHIKYYLPVHSDVQINIYSVVGRLMQTIKSSGQSAGDHVNVIDASQLQTGIYVVSITATNYSKAGKLVVQ